MDLLSPTHWYIHERNSQTDIPANNSRAFDKANLWRFPAVFGICNKKYITKEMIERFLYPLLWRHFVWHISTQKQLGGESESL